jgi:formate dehydrogenase subunit delta
MIGTVEKLVMMANQIAAAFAHQRGDPVAATAKHIHDFWSPAMRREIADHLRAGGADLTPIAAQAVAQLPAPTR